MNPIEQSTLAESEIAISNLDQFAQIITMWHHNRVTRLEHMLQVPVGTEMQIGEDAAVPLEGARYEGFIAGIQVALSEIGILPFTTTLPSDGEPEPAQPAEGETETVLVQENV